MGVSAPQSDRCGTCPHVRFYQCGFQRKVGCFPKYSHILDFGQDWDGNNVVVGNHLETNALSFHSYEGRQNYWLNVERGIPKHMSARYLCTITSSGHYYVYREGQLIADFASGHPVSPVARPHMYIGKSFWSWDGIFQGSLSKVCVCGITH